MTKLVNRAKMTTATTGTGTITLGSAVDGYQAFAAAGVANADVVRYVIEDGDAWEIGLGTYTASGTTLSRTVSESSNAGAALNLSGNAVVYVTATSADLLQPGDNITELNNNAGYTTNTGTVSSVAASGGTGISVSGSPITTSGTLTITNTAPHIATNLGVTGTGDTRTITSSTGTNVTIPVATTTTAGWLSTSDKTKLDGIAAGAQVNVATNLTYSTAATTGTVNSSTGTNATLPAATTSAAGLLTSADKTKLDGIAAGAQVNVATDLSVTAGTTAGPTINSSTGTNVVIPSASATASGIVTTGTQTFAGAKTFSSTITGSVSGNAGTATALQTARTIGGVSFNGTANINLPGVNTGGNQNTTGSAATLTTARTLTIGSTGKTFNGSANVAWSLAEIGVNNATLTLATSGIATGSQTFTSNQGTNGTFTVNVPATNLGYTTAASTGTVTSSTGTNATLPAATTMLAGLLTGADKTKLDGIAAGAQVNVATNLGYTTAASTGTVTSSTGTNATLPAATTLVAGLLTSADKTKLDGIAAGAQVNVATNLSATAGTTAGPTINSSTGTNVVIPSASATASGVVTTNAQTFAGVKTFSSTIIATTLSNGTVSVPTATVVNGSAKAWVNFNGTGTIAARDSFNVASLTDNGTGNYTVNFSNAMANANYCAQGSPGGPWALGANNVLQCIFPTAGYATNSVNVLTPFTDLNGIGQAFDVTVVNIAVVGDLA